MTCVVGVRGKSGVLLAGDSQMSWENGNRMSKDAKTFQLSDVLAVAYCGSGRLGQVLAFHLNELEDPPLGRDEQRWAVREFVPYLRGVTEDAGHLHIWHNVEELGESAFLLAVRGRLFMVEADFSVSEHRYAYDALGSGMETAIGAMRALAGDATEPLADGRLLRIATAGISAASEFTNYVGGAITSLKTVIYTDEERELAKQIAKPKR